MEASSRGYGHMEINVLNTGPSSHPGNKEPYQVAKPSFLFANTISDEWALTNAGLLLKGPNSFPHAPSYRDLHHTWGSAVPCVT